MRMSLECRAAQTSWARGLVAGLLVAVGLAGCSVDQTPARVCTGKSYSSYLSEVVEATIAYEKRCGILDAGGARDAQRKTLFLAGFPAYLTDLRDKAAADKRTGYDSTCFVSKLKDGACSLGGVVAAIQACVGQDAFGCLPAGRNCTLPEECQNGYCRGLTAGSACGAGVCQAKGSVGAACPEGDIACDPSKVYCKNGACQPLEQDGVDCEADNQCQSGLSCVRAAVGDVVGKCRAVTPGSEGQPCSLLGKIGQSCAAGLSCYKDDGNVYKCQKTAKVGEACKTSEACEGTATCVRVNVVDALGKCQALGGKGDACSADPAIGSACQITLSCYDFDKAPAPDCTMDTDCPTGKCDMGTNKCLKLPPFCSPQPVRNESCSLPTLDCLVDICDTSLATPRCRAKSGAGLSCANNNECVSGLCDTMTRKCKEPVCK